MNIWVWVGEHIAWVAWQGAEARGEDIVANQEKQEGSGPISLAVRFPEQPGTRAAVQYLWQVFFRSSQGPGLRSHIFGRSFSGAARDRGCGPISLAGRFLEQPEARAVLLRKTLGKKFCELFESCNLTCNFGSRLQLDLQLEFFKPGDLLQYRRFAAFHAIK